MTKFPPPVERGPPFRQMSCCLYDVDIASLLFSRLVANTPGTASRTVAEEGMRTFLDKENVIPFRR